MIYKKYLFYELRVIPTKADNSIMSSPCNLLGNMLVSEAITNEFVSDLTSLYFEPMQHSTNDRLIETAGIDHVKLVA